MNIEREEWPRCQHITDWRRYNPTTCGASSVVRREAVGGASYLCGEHAEPMQLADVVRATPDEAVA
jgi:hypothetical protein